MGFNQQKIFSLMILKLRRKLLITLIFGAGASHGSGGCSPTPPPLGNDLFNELTKLNGAFSMLDNSSKAIFSSEGFEAGMATISNDSRIINLLQKELACYISKFSVKTDNAYIRLFNKLNSCIEHINIATLNYDLLIEQSLAHHSINFNYNTDNNGINVIKLHGSSNFLPKIPNGIVLSGNAMINCDSFVEGLETIAVSTSKEIESWCEDETNSDLSPVIAMYAEGKRVVINRNTIQSIQTKYSEFIASSQLVVLVGIKYLSHDTHIWNPIIHTRPNLLIIDPYPKNILDWAKDNSFDNISVIEKSFDQSVWDITKAVHKNLFFT